MAEARIRARADLDDTGFKRGIDGMQQSVRSFTSGQLRQVAGMIGGAFTVGALINFGRQTLQRADDLGNLSRAAGMSMTSLQAMQWAMQEFGAATEESATAKLMKLVDSQEKAVNGNQTLIEAFRRLNITIQEVASLGTDQLLERVAAGARTSGTAVDDLNQIFGRGSAFEMKDALDKLADEGMGNLIDQAKQAGQVLEDELLRRIGQLNDDLARTQRQIGNTFVEWTAKASNAYKDFWAFWGAASSVGIREASRQMQAGEIGVAAERTEDAAASSKDERRRDAERQARVRALQDRVAAEAAERQAKAAKMQDREAAEAAERQAKAAKMMQEEITKVMQAAMPAISVSSPVAADQYARMGLFSGGQVNNSVRMVAERQLRVQEEMNRRLARVEALQERTATATERTADHTED